jgi:hypothetical protein
MTISAPGHYRRAAHAASQAEQLLTGPAADPAAAAAWAALAQVHATQAATAAALLAHLRLSLAAEDAWRDVLGMTAASPRPVIEGTTEPGTGSR